MAFDFERKQRVVILGGGPGGYAAALSAAQLGAEVTLIERTGVGGAAVLTDVVPSKTLIATAAAAQGLKTASDLGVQFFVRGDGDTPQRPEIAVNLAEVNKRLLNLAGEQSNDMSLTLKAAGVTVISGHGRLDGAEAVIVSTAAGGTDFDRIEADTVIVSVGASPRVLADALPDGERILTWTQLYNLTEVPEHIVVVGFRRNGGRVRQRVSRTGRRRHPGVESRPSSTR